VRHRRSGSVDIPAALLARDRRPAPLPAAAGSGGGAPAHRPAWAGSSCVRSNGARRTDRLRGNRGCARRHLSKAGMTDVVLPAIGPPAASDNPRARACRLTYHVGFTRPEQLTGASVGVGQQAGADRPAFTLPPDRSAPLSPGRVPANRVARWPRHARPVDARTTSDQPESRNPNQDPIAVILRWRYPVAHPAADGRKVLRSGLQDSLTRSTLPGTRPPAQDPS